MAIASILVIIVGSYIAYGAGSTGSSGIRRAPGHSTVYVAAVAVGSYAGFESVAFARRGSYDAHRTIGRSLLRAALPGVLYIVATYPQILFFDSATGTRRSAAARRVGRGPVGQPACQRHRRRRLHRLRHCGHHRGRSGPRSPSRTRALLPAALARCTRNTRPPWVGIASSVRWRSSSTVATFSSSGRVVSRCTAAVATWGFLTSYPSLVSSPRRSGCTRSGADPAAAGGVGGRHAGPWYVFSNFYPVPDFPPNILPLIPAGILLAGLAWYWYSSAPTPRVARRVGTIQTPSEAEQQRLIDEGLLGAPDDGATSAAM